MAEAASATQGPRQHRRTYLIDRKFQLKYTLLLAGWGLLVAVLFGLWLYQVQLHATEVAAADPALAPALAEARGHVLWVFAAIAGLMSLALGLLGVVITHRVAGPVFVMGHYMSVLASGRYPRMRTLRRGDELKSFFEVFLRAVARLKERDARHLAALDDAVARMRRAGSPELAPAIAALEEAARERRAALAADDPELTPMWTQRPRAGAATDGGR